jgi:hypothetical protein
MGRPALHLLMYSAVSLSRGHRQELPFLDLESMKPILASEEVWACQVDGHTQVVRTSCFIERFVDSCIVALTRFSC